MGRREKIDTTMARRSSDKERGKAHGREKPKAAQVGKETAIITIVRRFHIGIIVSRALGGTWVNPRV
jgi:hypothetical protein